MRGCLGDEIRSSSGCPNTKIVGCYTRGQLANVANTQVRYAAVRRQGEYKRKIYAGFGKEKMQTYSLRDD